MKTRQLTLIASAITLIGVFATPAQAVGSDQATMTAPAAVQALGSAIHSPLLNLLAKNGADDPAGDNRGGNGTDDAPDGCDDHGDDSIVCATGTPASLLAKNGADDGPDAEDDHGGGVDDAPDTDEDNHNMPSMLLAKNGADDPPGDDRGGDSGNSGSGSSGGSGSGRHCPDGTDDDDPTQPDVCV